MGREGGWGGREGGGGGGNGSHSRNREVPRRARFLFSIWHSCLRKHIPRPPVTHTLHLSLTPSLPSLPPFPPPLPKKEIGWFDTNNGGELATVLSEATTAFQEETGRRVAEGVQAIAQFTAGLVISFSQSWRLSLVLLAGLPLLGGAAAALSAVMAEAKAASSGQYAKAVGVANEALGAIRTVASLGAERKFTAAYNKLIEEAEKVGIGKIVKLGAANGMLFSSAFSVYALAFWYGSKQVADSLECVRLGGEGCITGGAVITTFSSFLIGAFSLGQLAPSLNAVAVARASLVRVIGIVKRTPVMDALSKEGKKLENVRGDIEFDVEGTYVATSLPSSLPPSLPFFLLCVYKSDSDREANAGDGCVVEGGE